MAIIGREEIDGNSRATGDSAGNLAAVIFFGSLWGIAEAVLGYPLHLLSRFIPGGSVAGFVMFPVGLFFMLGAYGASGKTAAVPAVAAVAALVKLASALSPAITLEFTVNPSLAILSEGLAVYAGLAMLGEKRAFGNIGGAAAVSFAYRIVFLVLLVALPVPKGILMKDSAVLLRFLLAEPVVNGLLVTAMTRIGIGTRSPYGRTPFAAGLSFAAAVGITMLLG